MIFGLVALAACQQGARGAAGEAGAQGPPGPQGLTGPRGRPGPDALHATGGATPQLILINNTGTAHDKLGDLANPSAGSLDASTFFVGGAPPVTYAGRGLPESGTFQVAVAGDDGTITISKRTASQTAPVAADYSTGAAFTIRATDANGVFADRAVVVKANKPPEREGPADYTALPSAPTSSAHAFLHYVVGTQEERVLWAGAPFAATAAWNGIWADARSNRQIGVAPDDASYYFRDEDAAAVTVAITEIDAEGAADDDEHVMAELTEDGDLTVTGLKSTWDAAASPPAHKPVRMEITATDPGGLTAKTWLYVWVDGFFVPATSGGTLQDNYVVKLSDGATTIVNALESFFVEPEGHPVDRLVTRELHSSAPLVATASINDRPVLPGRRPIQDLQVTPVNLGTATITILVKGPANPGPAGNDVQVNTLDRDDSGTITGGADGVGNGRLPGPQYGVATIQVTVVP